MLFKSRRVKFEIKEGADGRFIVGYGATFEDAGDYDYYGDIIPSTAFDDVIERLAEDGATKIKMLYQHRHDKPIGVWSKVYKDDTGLIVEGRIDETRLGNDVLTSIKSTAVDSLSIGFDCEDYSFLEVKTKWGAYVRSLDKIDLFEVSPVTFPANDQAKILEVRNRRIRETQALVQYGGYSEFDLLKAQIMSMEFFQRRYAKQGK